VWFVRYASGETDIDTDGHTCCSTLLPAGADWWLLGYLIVENDTHILLLLLRWIACRARVWARFSEPVVTDVALSVCLCVGRDCERCKIDWTDRNVVCGVDSWGLKEPCSRFGDIDPATGRGSFGGRTWDVQSCWLSAYSPQHKVRVKVAHTRLPSVGFQSWSRFLAVSLQVTWVINSTVGCHYFLPGLQLPPQPVKGLLPISLLGGQRHDGCEQFA